MTNLRKNAIKSLEDQKREDAFNRLEKIRKQAGFINYDAEVEEHRQEKYSC